MSYRSLIDVETTLCLVGLRLASSINFETRDKYYNKRSTFHENDDIQSHDQEECKLNTITRNSGVHIY